MRDRNPLWGRISDMDGEFRGRTWHVPTMSTTVKAISPSSIHSPQDKYSHVLTVEGNYRMVEITGQVGMKPGGTMPSTK